jgi:hypothetical protein
LVCHTVPSLRGVKSASSVRNPPNLISLVFRQAGFNTTAIGLWILITIGSIALRLIRFKVAEFFQLRQDATDALLNRLFVRLNNQLRVLGLLIGVVNAREALELALVDQFVEAFHITLTADLDGTLDVDLDKVTNFFSSPLACLTVGSNGGRDANDTIAAEQAAHEGNAFDIGIAVLAAKTQSLAQVSTDNIAV